MKTEDIMNLSVYWLVIITAKPEVVCSTPTQDK